MLCEQGVLATGPPAESLILRSLLVFRLLVKFQAP